MEADAKTVLLKYRLTGSLEQIAALADAVGHALREYPDLIFPVNLCLDELITNTITHGLQDGQRGEIIVILRAVEGYLEILIDDDAPEFDPFSAIHPDLDLPIEKRPIGGLGVHFVKTMMDDCQYMRRDRQNRILLKKKLPLESGMKS